MRLVEEFEYLHRYFYNVMMYKQRTIPPVKFTREDMFALDTRSLF